MPPRIYFILWAAFALAGSMHLQAQEPSDLEKGQRLFETHCAACHGPRGEGGKGPTLAQPSLPRATDDEALQRIIRNGLSGTEMPFSRLPDGDLKLVAAFVKSLATLPREPVPGNPENGAKLFATKGGCLQCHELHGKGGAFGPALDDIGLRRSVAYLRRSLVDPSADVPMSFSAFRSDASLPLNFLYVRIIQRDGTEVDGVRVNEDTFSIQIRDVSGHVHSFFKDEVAELHKDFGKSPMPSFATSMSKDEIDDLTAFLTTLHNNK